MNGAMSGLMSVGAIVLSTWTTYMTFFDDRYTLTVAVASVGSSVQTSAYSSSIDNVRETRRAPYVSPVIIASNQGTKSMVFTRVTLLKSTSAETCKIADGTDAAFPIKRMDQPEIYSPDSIQTLSFEFALPDVKNEGGTEPDLSVLSGLWCLQFVVFDHQGKRYEPLLETFRLDPKLVSDDEPDETPGLDLNISYPQGAVELVSKGAASPW